MAKEIKPEDLAQIRQPLECRLSPDGGSLAVVVSQPDRKSLKTLSHIWMVPTAGGDPRQFTQGTGGDRAPRFSPDGTTLAFLSSRSGSSEIWTMPMRGGEARQLTTLDGSIGEFEFSPDGKKLVATFTPKDPDQKEREKRKKLGEPGQETPRIRALERILYKLDGAGFLPKSRTHIWSIDALTGKARQLTKDDRYDESAPTFSPDGSAIYFCSNRSRDPDLDPDRVDIWRMDRRGGGITKVRTFDGPSTTFSISPDGAWIAFHGIENPGDAWGRKHTKLWVVPAGGGRPVEVTASVDRDCGNSTINDTFGTGSTPPPAWSPDGKSIYFLLSTEGNTEIWKAQKDATRRWRCTMVVNRRGVVIHPAYDFRRGSIYASFSDHHTPGEVVQFTQRDSQVGARLTRFNEWLADKNVAVPEELWFEGKGRHRLQGWILRPAKRSARRSPAVLYIHGGPATQYGRTYFHEFQVLAARGYTVFYSNPRGGTGYSETHLSAIWNAWGTLDYDDLMRFTDEALRRCPEVDPRRVGVAGGSYGGYMTNWIIGHTNRFAAAVTQRCVSNLMSFAGSSDFGYMWPRMFGGKAAWSDPMHYLKMSPILYVDAIKTPTLIEHQEDDHRCPIEQAEQLFAALKTRGVPVEFHRYPEESHGMSRGGRPDRRIERLERTVGWFDRWLAPARRSVTKRTPGRVRRGRARTG